MNKIKIHIIALALISLTACSESFLDVESKTTVTSENYYRTIQDAERALIGCYDGWQCTTSNGAWPSFYQASEFMADECLGGGGPGDNNSQLVDRFDLSYNPGQYNLYNSLWVDYYAAIYRCNTLIMKLDQIKWGEDKTSRPRIEGETRALRALLYFDLVRLLGNIPLLTEPTTDNLPQANPDDVYRLIAEDLKFAAENIPANAYPKKEAEKNDGRITSYAAKALLARVYLYYTGYYGKSDLLGIVTQAQALEGLEDVIESNEYDLVGEFKNLWPAACSVPIEGEHAFETTYAGRGNIETVLAQKFNDTQDYNGNSDGNRWLVNLGIRGLDISPYGKGWGQCTVHPKMWNTVYEANDTRREASIINLVTEGIDKQYNKEDQRDYSGFMIKKYTPMAFYDGKSASKPDGTGDFMVSQNQDFIVVRYSDVLLMAAELGSPNAQQYYNRVRQRAGLGNKPVSKENILQERLCEFAFEGLRYWDLLRQGVDAAANIIAESDVEVLQLGVKNKVVINGNRIRETKGLSQIPTTQIQLSGGVLKQNDGWK